MFVEGFAGTQGLQWVWGCRCCYGNPSGFRLSVGVEGVEFALWAEGS